MNHRIIHDDCLGWLSQDCLNKYYNCIFADPPDNIGLDYGHGAAADRQATNEYLFWLRKCLHLFVRRADIVWVSCNAKWQFHIGVIIQKLLRDYDWLQAKLCIQIFTFGQCNQYDLGNCFRPLLRLKRDDAPLYPDQIRVPSWRQEHGDKRADPRGRVPSDVLQFPRVTGNSKQRRSWCPTQLHEGLIERCIKLSTKEGDTVLDPFAGTGTTLRVCKRINRNCILIEQNPEYCNHIAKEHGLEMEYA